MYGIDESVTILGYGFIVKNTDGLTGEKLFKKIAKKYKIEVDKSVVEFDNFDLTDLVCEIFGDDSKLYVNQSINDEKKTWFVSINGISFSRYGKSSDYINIDKMKNKISRVDKKQQKSLEKLHNFLEEFYNVTEINTFFYTFMCPI